MNYGKEFVLGGCHVIVDVRAWAVEGDGRLCADVLGEGMLVLSDGGGVEVILRRGVEGYVGSLLLGVAGAGGGLRYAGVSVGAREERPGGEVCLSGGWGGAGEGVLRRRCIFPEFDRERMLFGAGVSEGVMRTWEGAGLYEAVLLDRVQVCPGCGCLPSFRMGCRRCGSGRTIERRSIHHYACGACGGGGGFQGGGGGGVSEVPDASADRWDGF